MKYLAISKTTEFWAYAIFEEKKLLIVGRVLFSEIEKGKQHQEWYEKITKLIDEYQIGVLLNHDLMNNKYNVGKVRKLISMKAVIRLACTHKKVLFIEARTNGWEKYITKGKATLKKKLDIVNDGYGLNLKYYPKNFLQGEEQIADAVILGEAVAHQRIHV